MQGFRRLVKFARKPPREKLKSLRYVLADEDWYWKVRRPRNDRTAYIIGLFGTGRHYVNQLVQQHIGRRAEYFRDAIRFHQGPTPMIYSGHATLKYPSRGQALPEEAQRILEDRQSQQGWNLCLAGL